MEGGREGGRRGVFSGSGSVTRFTLPTRYQHVTHTLPTRYQHVTNTLPTRYQHDTTRHVVITQRALKPRIVFHSPPRTSESRFTSRSRLLLHPRTTRRMNPYEGGFRSRTK